MMKYSLSDILKTSLHSTNYHNEQFNKGMLLFCAVNILVAWKGWKKNSFSHLNKKSNWVVFISWSQLPLLIT